MSKTFYLQVEVEMDDTAHWDVESLGNELYRTCVFIEVAEDFGFDGTVNRVAIKPF